MTETKRSTGSSIVGMGRRVSGCAMKLFHTSVSPPPFPPLCHEKDALGDPLKHGPRLQNKCRQNNATQVSAWPQLRDDVGEN